MRIAQMIDSLDWGGTQKMQVFLAETLRPLGIDLTVISLSATSNSIVPDKLHQAGAKVVVFPFLRLVSPRSFVKLSRYLYREQFDLVHAHLTYSNIVGPVAGRLAGTPSIASLRSAGTDPRYFRPRRMRLESLVLRHVATRVMGNGWEVARLAHRRTGRTVDVLPNAIDPIPPLSPEKRLALRREILGDPERMMLLSVARLSLPKGFADLINAYNRVRKTYPRSALVIAGGGDLCEDLKAQITALGLQEHVYLLGVRNDVHRLLSAADIYVNSSHWEGLPVTVLEAMASALPLVATSVGDTPNVVVPGTGLLVPPHQPKALAREMCRLLGSPDLRQQLGQAALAHIKNNFNRANWRRNLLELYAKVTPRACQYLADLDRVPLRV